jgi:DsbC/DsbD-like thiol-disulfide interchange protein
MKLLLGLAVCAVAAVAADPVTWKVQEGPPARVKPGGRFTVRLAAQVQSGWHIYGLRPVENGPIATRIWVADGQPVQLAGAVQGTDPLTMHDPTFNMEVQVYEGEVVFTLPLRIGSSVSEGTQKFFVNASYQACDNKICLPTRTVKVDVSLTVAK